MSERRMQWLQRLRNALLDAFPERSDLEQQLWFQRGVRLDEIASDSANLTDTIFELLKWSEAHGQTEDLLRALSEARPDRDDLKQLLQEYQGLRAEGSASPDQGLSVPAVRPTATAGSLPAWASTMRGRVLAAVVIVTVLALVAVLMIRGPSGAQSPSTRRASSVEPVGPAAPAPATRPSTASNPGAVARLSRKEVAAIRILMQSNPERFRLESGHRITFWPNGSTIAVAFLDGSNEFKALVRRLSAEWSKYGNVHFKFVSDPSNAEVRVSFKGDRAYSHWGTDSLGAGTSEPTAVMGGLPTQDSAEHAYTILHELGHVLGLIHEIQIPDAKNFVNWSVVYDKAALPPNEWSHETVDITLRTPADIPTAYVDKKFDPESVMNSNLPDDWLVEGAYLAPGSALSDGDKQFIAKVYPPNH